MTAQEALKKTLESYKSGTLTRQEVDSLIESAIEHSAKMEHPVGMVHLIKRRITKNLYVELLRDGYIFTLNKQMPSHVTVRWDGINPGLKPDESIWTPEFETEE